MPSGHREEQIVAGRAADAVVDHFELVDVEIDDADRRRVPPEPFQGLAKAVEEEQPVRQPGQRVVKRLVGKGDLGRLLRRDVLHRPMDPLSSAGRVDARSGHSPATSAYPRPEGAGDAR